MFDYETGIFVAFLVWLYNAVMLIVTVNSRLERNINRLGQRISWTTYLPKPMVPADLSRSTTLKVLRYLLIVGFGLPFVLLSWLYVALVVAGTIYRRAKDSGAPQAVREFRWKLRNTDMTFDQLVREMMKAEDEDLSKFEEYRASVVNDLQNRGLPHG